MSANGQADHTALNTQVSQYFHAMKYSGDGFEGEWLEGEAVGPGGAEGPHETVGTEPQTPSLGGTMGDPLAPRPPNMQQGPIAGGRPLVLKMDTPPTRICPFCSKTFQHQGSLGRHLDHQKGNELHPASEVAKLRGKVARRGNPDEVRARRVERSREYNRRDYVKEKNRVRRQLQARFQKARDAELRRFYRRIALPSVPAVPTFPFMVLMFLPCALWPQDPPTAETYRMLREYLEEKEGVRERVAFLGSSGANKAQDETTPVGQTSERESDNDFLNLSTLETQAAQDTQNAANRDALAQWLERLKVAFESWQGRSAEARTEIWQREQRAITRQLLGDLTYFDYAVRENYARHLMVRKREEEGESGGGKGEYDKLDEADLAAVAAAAAAAVKGYGD